MCGIYGAVSQFDVDKDKMVDTLADRASDRGRDGGGRKYYTNYSNATAVLGHHRAAPTPEGKVTVVQPYEGLVHNGTITNDLDLGRRPTDVDSMTLARYLDKGIRADVGTLASALNHVEGSYALSCWNGSTVLGATNFKPLYYAKLFNATYFSSMARHFEGLLPPGHAPVAVEPYTVIDFLTFETATLDTEHKRSAVVVASGGLDSTVAAAKLQSEGYDVRFLHFRYGCRAQGPEASRIKSLSCEMKIPLTVIEVPMRVITNSSSSLLDNSELADGRTGARTAHEWVPGRNFVFTALATAFAESHGYHAVATGVNLEEAGAYPDNEEQLTHYLNLAAPYSVAPHHKMNILAPVGNLMKHEIVKLGLELDVPLEPTWSCYRGGEGIEHCGNCGSCYMRKKAFEWNQIGGRWN